MEQGRGNSPPTSLTSLPLQELGQEELFVAVEMLSAVVLINRALEAGDVCAFWDNLVNPATGLAQVEEENAQR
jgi:Ras GTPase-activating-like protein IQGAP2/3